MNSNKKNILFVLPMLPWPLSSGGNQAMFNGIEAVKDVANVFVAYPIFVSEKKEREGKALEKELGENVQLLPYLAGGDAPIRRKLASRICDYLERKIIKGFREHTLDRLLSISQVPQREVDYINGVINEKSIDIVQIEMLSQITLVNSLPDHVRKVFVHHELGYVKNLQLLSEYGSDDYYKSMWESYKIEEIGLLNKYDDIIVLSEIDKQKLQSEGVRVPVHSSFAVVKSVQYNPHIDDYHNIIFIGTPKHRPNFLAVMWFLKNCWENLLELDPHYRLKIIGVWDKENINTINSSYSNVCFTGFVNDLREELKDGIMIVPITVGSGIRMKILEAANYGIPVVSTSVGAEGLPLRNGENAFVADNPEDFVACIIKLKDKKLREQFTDSLYKMVRSEYSLEALKANRRDILNL